MSKLDYYEGEWCWVMEYNDMAESGSHDSLIEPWRDPDDIKDRASTIADRYVIAWWSSDD